MIWDDMSELEWYEVLCDMRDKKPYVWLSEEESSGR